MITTPMLQPMLQPILNDMFGRPEPILFMPLIDSLDLHRGVGAATFTASTIRTFVDKDDRLVKTAAIDVARLEADGYLSNTPRTNEALHNRDFTDVVHVKTNITPLKDAIGADGVANSASTLTATAANGTAFQTVTKLSAENTFSIDIRRKTGTGTIEITDDGGVSFTDVTVSINASTYTRFEITKTQANPSFGVRIVNSGDEIEVDYEQLEVSPYATARIETGATPVGVTADILSAPISLDSRNSYSVTMDVSLLGLSDDLTVDRFLFGASGTSFMQANVTSAQLSQVQFNAGSSSFPVNVWQNENVVNKTAFIRDVENDEGRSTIDGITAVNSGLGVIPANNTGELFIGSSSGMALQIDGHIKNFRLYDLALIPTQVA